MSRASVSACVKWGYADELTHKILRSLLKVHLVGLGLGFPAVGEDQDPSLQHCPPGCVLSDHRQMQRTRRRSDTESRQV